MPSGLAALKLMRGMSSRYHGIMARTCQRNPPHSVCQGQAAGPRACSQLGRIILQGFISHSFKNVSLPFHKKGSCFLCRFFAQKCPEEGSGAKKRKKTFEEGRAALVAALAAKLTALLDAEEEAAASSAKGAGAAAPAASASDADAEAQPVAEGSERSVAVGGEQPAADAAGAAQPAAADGGKEAAPAAAEGDAVDAAFRWHSHDLFAARRSGIPTKLAPGAL